MKQLLFFFAIALSFPVFGQKVIVPKDQNAYTKWKTPDPEAAIKAIKDGALLIQLPTYTKKINKMKEVAALPKTSEANRQYLLDEVAKIEAETEENNRLLVEQLYKNYRFSPFYVFYDNALDKVEKTNLAGIFLDENMEIDPEIILKEETYCLMREGMTTEGVQNDRQPLEAFVILNAEGKMMDDPFPYYFRINTLKYTFNSILDRKNAKSRKYRDLVKKMNIQFSNFYAVASY